MQQAKTSTSFGCGACTLVCYAIAISLGWVFSRVTIPHDEPALGGAIVISIPVLLFVGAIIIDCVYCTEADPGSGK